MAGHVEKRVLKPREVDPVLLDGPGTEMWKWEEVSR